MSSTCERESSQSSQLTVKNTFLEFMGEATSGQRAQGLRVRASSDPGFFDVGRQGETEEGKAQDIVLRGLSDDETDTEEQQIALPCYSHLRDIPLSLHGDQTSSCDSADESGLEKPSELSWADVRCRAGSKAMQACRLGSQAKSQGPPAEQSSSISHRDMEPLPTSSAQRQPEQLQPAQEPPSDPLQQEVERLATENARLKQANSLLMTQCREAVLAAQHTRHTSSGGQSDPVVQKRKLAQKQRGQQELRARPQSKDQQQSEQEPPLTFQQQQLLQQRLQQVQQAQQQRLQVKQRQQKMQQQRKQQGQQQGQKLTQQQNLAALEPCMPQGVWWNMQDAMLQTPMLCFALPMVVDSPPQGCEQAMRQNAHDFLQVGHVPSRAACQSSDPSSSACLTKAWVSSEPVPGPAPDEERTTVMLRNLPNNYSRAMIISMIDGEGFAGHYDFLYLPMDFSTKACLGYAFVNLVNHEQACRFWAAFDGFSRWVIPSKKQCGVSWSNPHQGLQSNIERYRNSPVMHEAVADEYKPIVLCNGRVAPFPEPTKKIRAPRMRNYMLQPKSSMVA